MDMWVGIILIVLIKCANFVLFTVTFVRADFVISFSVGLSEVVSL